MNKEQMISLVQESFDELNSTIADSVEQLFNNSLKMDLVDEDIDMETAFEEKGEHICVFFKTTTSNYELGHVFLFSPEIASQLYAWMIGAEPEGEVNEEHFEGLKEATDQIFGRVKMSITSDDAPTMDTVQIIKAASSAEFSDFTQEKEGNSTRIILQFGDKNFEIIHHLVPFKYETGQAVAETGDMGDAVDIQPAEFDTMTGKSVQNHASKNIDMLMDVELEVTVELGKKSVLISDVLKLGKGSILELEKSAGENLDIIVNGKKLAEGEVVVIDEHFGIRITQLISPKERVQLLQ